ncbi:MULTISPECIES: hypothetical protein [Streptomycetaceae]|uniref:hypothetical protein n=1 Tax=Streptomycetaceae TaxID=2062 RepID=UPI00300A0218
MTDFAGVNPQRLRQLANRLADLAAALASDGGTIRTDFDRWGGSLNLSAIGQQAQQVGDDAHAMALRADEALNLLDGAGQPYLCGINGDMYQIPWDTKDIDPAKEAQQEASELSKALANPKDPNSRQIILNVAQSLSDHGKDSAYMTAFMINGGIKDMTGAANALHAEDGTHDNTLLSKESVAAMAQFGQATQTLADLAVKGDYPHPAPDYLAPLTHPTDDDAWSIGMLLKYGPSGDKWNAQVLSDISGGMLDWREKQGAMRPDYEMFPGGGAYPGYYGDGKAWFDDLGLTGAVGSKSGADQTVAAIRANDPVLAVLDRLGDNAQGSRDLLGQNTAASKGYAADLLEYNWQTTSRTGTVDDSEPIGRVLTLAASDRSPDFADQSGQAAYNILAAAAKENSTFAGRSQKEQLAYFTYPQSTAVALAGITATWADQLGASSKIAGSQAGGYSTTEHGLVLPHDDLQAAMELFTRDDPSAAAMFDTAMHAQLSDAAGSSDDITNLGNMIGLFTKAKNNISYSAAQQLDEQHKANLAVLNTAGVLFSGTSLPKGVTDKVVTKGFKYSQTLATWGRSVKAPTTDPFSTDNAAAQQAVNSKDAKDVEKAYAPALAQGLIRSGKIPAPAGQTWYDPKTQTVSPDAWQNTDFTSWFTGTSVASTTNGVMGDLDSGFRTYEGSLDGN